MAAVATLFSTGLVFRQPGFDFFAHYAVLPVLFVAGCILAGGALSRSVLLVLGFLSLHTLWSIALFRSDAASALQQLLGIAVALGTFQYVLRANGGNFAGLFALYVRCSVAVCAVALLQVLAFGLDLRPGYDLSWLLPDYHVQYSHFGMIRVQSVMLEPAHLGIVLSPAIHVGVSNLTGRPTRIVGRLPSLVILAAAALSFSTVAYAAILLSLALIAARGMAGGRNVGLAIVLVPASLSLATAAYAYVPEIRLRADDLVSLFFHQSLASANLSSLTLYNNAHVAWQSLLSTHLFGGGLGSHPASFDRHTLLFGVSELTLQHAMLNNVDASSLLLRLASELGLPGVAMGLLFILRYRVPTSGVSAPAVRTSEDGVPAWVVSDAVLVFLGVSLTRQGHYFNFGLPFFGLLYYHAGRFGRLAAHRRRLSNEWVAG